MRTINYDEVLPVQEAWISGAILRAGAAQELIRDHDPAFAERA